MNEQLAKLISQQNKNVTLLILCSTGLLAFHPTHISVVIGALCALIGAQKLAENWAAKGNADEVAKLAVAQRVDFTLPPG